MKTRFITLQQTDEDEVYVVDQLANTVEPRVGSFLAEWQIRDLIQRRDTKVTIKRAKT